MLLAGIQKENLDARLRGHDEQEELSCFVVSLRIMTVRIE
jgi:hypothetical protein